MTQNNNKQTDSGLCVVIGASGGIGRSLCERLSASGWGLVLAGRRNDPLETLAQSLGSCVKGVVPADAGDFDAVDQLFAAHPNITAAVNLAGSILLKPAHSTSASDYEETMDQNVRTAFAVVRAAGKAMRQSGGSVVLVSSCAAQFGLPNHEAISAAKAAVEGLTRSAAATYAGAGLRFNAVAPGLTETPMSARLTANEASRDASTAMHPLGRLGRPADVAAMIQFLIDPDNSWITGQTFAVDGGLAHAKAR